MNKTSFILFVVMFISVFVSGFYRFYFSRDYTYIMDEQGTEAYAKDVSFVFED